MNYKPNEDRIIVQVKITDITDGGIILSGESRIKEQIATVVAVGPGKYGTHTLLPMTVKVGDRVCFPQYTGNKLSAFDSDADDDLWILKESEVIAVVG